MPHKLRYVDIASAKQSDDADLRRLLRENSMPGRISLSFRREPSFFEAIQVEGERTHVVTAKDKQTKKIVGFGTRSVKNCYLNDKITAVGYLSGLRLEESYRNGLAVARGYKHLRQIHNAEKVRYYFTTIVEDNILAKRLLTSGKAGLPRYVDGGQYITLAYRARASEPKTHTSIRRATEEDIPAIIDFLNTNGRKRQLFPHYTETHLRSATGILRGLTHHDIYIAESANRILGTLALWNQKSFRQTVIETYSRSVHIAKPLYNLLHKIYGKPILPAKGELDYGSCALCCILNDQQDIFIQLLKTVLSANKNLHSVLLGLHETDALLSAARGLPHIPYLSRLYYVYWDNSVHPTPDGRTPYLELGAL
ncbi:MAG: hypothetical protein ACRBF0_09835 [Calditrichia bacterium]